MQQADENLKKENTQGYSLQNKGFLTPRVAAGPAPSPSSQLAWQQREEEDWIFISPASWSFGTALTPPRAPSLEGLRQPQLLPCLLKRAALRVLGRVLLQALYNLGAAAETSATSWQGSFPRMFISLKALSKQKAGQNAESDNRHSWVCKCKVFKTGALAVICVPISRQCFQRRMSVIILPAIMDLLLTLLVQIYGGLL